VTAILAELLEVVETTTPYGGRATSFEPVGHAWLKLGARRRRNRDEAGGRRAVETVAAETRSDPRLIVGRALRFQGSDWRIATGETVGGRAILILERMR